MRRDLLDAYNDAGCEEMPASVAAEEQPHSTVRCVCTKCGSLPAPGDKLRYCGRCEVTTYCNKQCARAHWAEHKVMCEILREGHKRESAAHEARGGRKKNYNQVSRDTVDYVFKIPGLINVLQLLAWKHRLQFRRRSAARAAVPLSRWYRHRLARRQVWRCAHAC